MANRKRGPRKYITASGDYNDLTPRQKEVAGHLAAGKFNAEIADALQCSQKTVDTHRGFLLARLGLRNNVELVLHLIKIGVVAPELPHDHRCNAQ